jgi:energy-coupling factor transporter ATP-binding protein EcfA2
VRIKLRPDITTIVGGNESGKTQVLAAIESALTGNGIVHSDFCRYSRFFGNDKDLSVPEFGVSFSKLTDKNLATIKAMTGLRDLDDVDCLAIFRMNNTPKLRAYVRSKGSWSEAANIKTPSKLSELGMPIPFRINADVPLPDSVPLQYLVSQKPVASLSREIVRAAWSQLADHLDWFNDQASVTSHANEIQGAFRPVRDANPTELQTYQLASDLLIKVAGIKPELFSELQKAVNSKSGYAHSLVDTINEEISKALNFAYWWSQDSEFELFVKNYEYDLLFMIRDRTGRTYGFDERSDGLKYFLSYFVQYLAHEFPADNTPELLLMDEPDRFLSSSGQQDLLKIFEDFARPKDAVRAPVQVVYVTHSPFLIDKNAAERIRVLEKGEHDEGTRIVSSASANHYEPLRSAFGSFVAETTFVGNCNLMVEGASDQVLLAGTARWLTQLRVPHRDKLDLNQVTIVPAGGTPHIPYLVYLARGLDVEKPPVVVLLDNDSAGDTARELLQAGGAYGSSLIIEDFVLQIGKDSLSGLATKNPDGIVGIEDLVPLSLAIDAAHAYCLELVPDIDVKSLALQESEIFAVSEAQGGGSHKKRDTLSRLQGAIRTKADKPKFHLDKVAFARAIVDLLPKPQTESDSSITDVDKELEGFRENFTLLQKVISERQRQATRVENVEKISSRINRIKSDFLRTRKQSANREHVLDLMEEIAAHLDNSPEAEDVRVEMRGWHEQFDLSGDPFGEIEDFAQLTRAISSIAYKAVNAASIPAGVRRPT